MVVEGATVGHGRKIGSDKEANVERCSATQKQDVGDDLRNRSALHQRRANTSREGSPLERSLQRLELGLCFARSWTSLQKQAGYEAVALVTTGATIELSASQAARGAWHARH